MEKRIFTVLIVVQEMRLWIFFVKNFSYRPFDKNGEHAKSGKVHIPSLNKMLGHSFFKRRHPKSTGKEIFNIEFIPKQLLKKSSNDILATLTELTAISIAKSLLSLQEITLSS